MNGMDTKRRIRIEIRLVVYVGLAGFLGVERESKKERKGDRTRVFADRLPAGWTNETDTDRQP